MGTRRLLPVGAVCSPLRGLGDSPVLRTLLPLLFIGLASTPTVARW